MRQFYYRYTLRKGARRHPTWASRAIRTVPKSLAIISLALLVALFGLQAPLDNAKPADTVTQVAGQSNMICDDQSQLTSPWTYNALVSGSQSYTVHDYQQLPGYGTTFPPLPSYITNENATTTAAIIYAPGATVSNPAYDFPQTPVIQFFEGGAYTDLDLQSISGDEFIGGSATGYPEPTFDDGGNAGGINGATTLTVLPAVVARWHQRQTLGRLPSRPPPPYLGL